MLNERLLELRKLSKLTQVALSSKLKIARTTYSGYELGTSEPDNETLERMADFYGVTVDNLLGRETKVNGTKEETEMERMKKEIYEIIHDAKTEEDIKSMLHIVKKVMKE